MEDMNTMLILSDIQRRLQCQGDHIVDLQDGWVLLNRKIATLTSENLTLETRVMALEDKARKHTFLSWLKTWLLRNKERR